ncbi:MAG: helix-turn-helix domain-containing protein [Bacteroidales bacterium]|jgi:y4mF family transcriptional regulator|nr:helix-turn-helix domain-containing protein [Bacteroidales bacterium]
MKIIKNTKELGKLIRAKRTLLKVTQKELALAAGTGLRFIIDVERGKETCRVGKIFDVLQALGLSLQTSGMNGFENGGGSR